MHNRTLDRYLSKDETKIMKAIAMICMLMHHLWSFPNRIPDSSLGYFFTFFNQPSIFFFGMFGTICVPFFFFLGGYGVYKQYYNKKYDLVAKIKALYISYWKVFLIFIPIAFLFFSSQDAYCSDSYIHTRYNVFSKNEFLGNFIGFFATYNREWWFLFSYAISLATFPIIRAFIENNSTRKNVFIAIIMTLLIPNIFPGLANVEWLGTLRNNQLYLKIFCQIAPYATCFWMGIIVANNGLLDRLSYSMKKNNILNPVIDILLWIGIIFMRQRCIGETMDIFYLPVLTVATIDFLRRFKILKKIFLEIGKQSTNMWLIHSFFAYYFGAVAKIVVAPHNAVLSLLVLIVMSYVASLAVTYFWKGIGILFNKCTVFIKNNQSF